MKFQKHCHKNHNYEVEYKGYLEHDSPDESFALLRFCGVVVDVNTPLETLKPVPN